MKNVQYRQIKGAGVVRTRDRDVVKKKIYIEEDSGSLNNKIKMK